MNDETDDDTRYAVVLDTGFQLRRGGGSTRNVATLSVYGDQPLTGGIKTNQTRKVGTLVESDIPAVLRKFADFYEQEGSLHAIAERFREMEK